jgi:hypothetical protein
MSLPVFGLGPTPRVGVKGVRILRGSPFLPRGRIAAVKTTVRVTERAILLPKKYTLFDNAAFCELADCNLPDLQV